MNYFLYLVLLICTACTRDPIQVYTEYITVEDLASYEVGTPDPYLIQPNQGQRFVVFWSIPRHKWGYNKLTLNMRLRFGNREEMEDTIEVFPGDGTYRYCLMNEDYFSKKGIQSYRVQLFGDGILLDERLHQLWVELIEF